MPAPQTKIITKLLDRRKIEAGLREVLQAPTELEFRRRAQQVAALGPQVIPTIIANLDRADAQMLTAMGVVTTFLERTQVVKALRQAVLQARLSDRGRVGAMTILQRFLGEDSDQQLLGSLDHPEGVAVSSLEDILQQATRDPGVLIPYVEALDRQEPDVVLAVVQRLVGAAHRPEPSSSSPSEAASAGPERARVVEPLRMMAQDVRDEIAAAALEGLAGLRLPEAVRALQSLLAAMPPELQPVAGRLLRKLQFSGVQVDPLPPVDPAWRALLSPPGSQGQQSVWFVFQEEGAAEVRFLNVLLHDRAGAVEAVAHPQVPVLMLPPSRPEGHVHDVALPDGSGVMLMLEVPFDLGRRLVRDALADNHETQVPVAGPLRRWSGWLWGVQGADSLPARRLPELAPHRGTAEEGDPAGGSAALLGQPAFVTWTLRGDLLLAVAEEMVRHPGWDLDRGVRRLAGELFSNPEVTEVFRQRLAAMSEWLLLAGDEASARLALAVAGRLATGPAEEPFVQALVRRDLTLILRKLQEHPE